MPKTNRRKRHRILALVAAGAMALVVVLIVAIVIVVLRRPETPQTALPPTAVPSAPVPPTPGQKPRPEFQDASCPDVMMISIPGAWESSPQLDPVNPTQFPIALLLSVSKQIRSQFGNDVLEIFTVPYTAQFHNPLSADQQMSYNDSRAEGTRAAVKATTRQTTRYPWTRDCS